MFKKSRRKIVAAIMSILVSLWVGTLCVIYGSSYYEVSNRSREMLERHVELYLLEHPPANGAIPDKPPGPDMGRPHFEDTPAFQLSTFYSVAISKDGQTLEINNGKEGVYSNRDLEQIAYGILENGHLSGVKDNLIYCMADKGGYTLIAFMDNTIIKESMTTLFQYTLIFGGLAMLALFFLASYLAKKIVQPLEISYQKQKQFISDAGHELKTPVSVVSANAELLSRELGPNQWLANIQYENERMGMLVGQLLELARTENVTPVMESLDFSRLIGGEALPFESVVFEKGLSLQYKITRQILVQGNSPQLKQLTSILLDNAIRHSKPGGEILLTLENKRNYACLIVTNEGEEIPEEQKKQIFERFYRADPARNSESQHYGLGLAIAKAIVDAHNGKIDVKCFEGKVAFAAQIPLNK